MADSALSSATTTAARRRGRFYSSIWRTRLDILSKMVRSTMKRSLPLQCAQETPSELKKAKVICLAESSHIFIDVVSKLTDDQRTIVRDIGFYSLLSLSCSSVPCDLLLWLVDHFNTSTRTLQLPNGFEFTLNSTCVQKILGIPSGFLPIQAKGTLESFLFFSNEIKSKGLTPSVEELRNFITPELSGCQFARAFLLLALSTFLCPNTRRVCSSRYYPAVINVTSIRDRDWSALVLDWLVFSIDKFQTKRRNNETSISIGGCVFVLVISYLEFLSTSEFSIHNQCPRITVWSSGIVQALAYLDSLPDFPNKFGRLQLKHICCTPFKDCFLKKNSQHFLPEDLQKLMDYHLSSSSKETVTNLVMDLLSTIQSSVGQDILAYISSCIENIIRVMCNELNVKDRSHISQTFLEDTDSDVEEVEDITLRTVVACKSCNHKKLSDETIQYFSKYFPLLPTEDLDVTDDSSHIFREQFQKLQIQQVSSTDNDILTEIKCSLPNEELFWRDIKKIVNFGPCENSYPCLIDVKSLVLDSLLSQRSLFTTNFYHNHDHFSNLLKAPLQSDVSQGPNVQHAGHAAAVFPQSYILENDAEKHCTFQDLDRSQYDAGGYRIFPTSKVSTGLDESPISANVPNFDIFADVREIESENNHLDSGCSLVKEFRQGFRKCSELLSHEHKLGNVASHLYANQSASKPQVIFATATELEFFNLLTTNIASSNSSFSKIVQIGSSWVDQRKLSLSMMNGGWIHYHVMDCFAKMLNCNQKLIEHVQGHIYQHYFEHSIAKILMDSSINHTNFKKDFLQLGGFDIQKGGLLYIPCYINKQWVLVVVNFNKKRFDILNPDYSADASKSTIHSVIYNFRCFFILGYPNSSFNIRDFDVCYVDVPKHKFRYDSGIFVLNFLETYNGDEVQQFSNVDVVHLRAKFLFQIATTVHNNSKSQVVHHFVQNHALQCMTSLVAAHSRMDNKEHFQQ
ncbi:hypothetical protein ACP70R_009839 [Stipagrostis hirtigluma subsp. patula]